MKQRYKSIKTFIVLLSIIAMKAWAQPLSGSYTIVNGGIQTSTTFTSLGAFANALNTNGVSGAVVVDIAVNSGPYTEQVTFNQIAGASASRNITINGNGNLIQFNSSTQSSPQIIGMNGADYFTFNNLQLKATGTYGYPVLMYNTADNNVFSACTMSVPANSTSTNQIPILLAGWSTSSPYYYNSGNSANNNTFLNCTTFSGYYGIWVSGYTTSPYQLGNSWIGCNVMDWYYAGFDFQYYIRNHTIKNCTIKCPTRTNYTSAYGIYAYACDGLLIEGNKISNFWDANHNNTNYSYGMYIYYNLNSSYLGVSYNHVYPDIIKNNLISDMSNNGYAYGIYWYGADAQMYNNTIALDYAAATGSSYIYGINGYGGTGYGADIYNNIISVTQGGTGQKYALYTSGVTNFGTIDRNDFYVNATTGTNYIAYYSSQVNTLPLLQAQGIMATGFAVNPQYVNIAGQDYHPTNAAINNTAIVANPPLVYDVLGAIRNPTTPDIGALEFLTPPCALSPSLASVVSPTYGICPGSVANLGLSILQTDAGISWQWQTSSLSSVGPWTPISGATSPFYTTPPVNSNLYYSVQITCANGGGSLNAVSGQVMVAGTTTNNAPYHETFEGVAYNGQLPNCSWSISSSTTNIQTHIAVAPGYQQPHTGSKYMAFAANSSTAATQQYAYSSGIYLNPGITYTAGLWYLTEFSGLTNFTDLSFMLSTTQSTSGIVSNIGSTNGPAVATQYKALSNTLTVNSAGLYYLVIRASNTPANYFLSVDDIFVEIPCTPQYNTPTVTVSGPASICLGTPISLTASGATTYSWTLANSSFASNNAGISYVPTQAGTANFMINATSGLTGCQATVNKVVNVLGGPIVSAFSSDADNRVCPGVVTVLHAVGTAVSYTWSTTNNASPSATIMPTGSAVYTVYATNSTNCVSTATINIDLETPPSVSGVASRSTICIGENVTLTGSGADTYQWISNASVLVGNPVVAAPTSGPGVNYQLTGTDALTGCSSTAVVSLIVSTCQGLTTISADNSAINLYPNPNNGDFTLELNNASDRTIHVTDLSGRVLMSQNASDATVHVNMSELSNGVYFVKVQSNEKVSVIKIVKQ